MLSSLRSSKTLGLSLLFTGVLAACGGGGGGDSPPAAAPAQPSGPTIPVVTGPRWLSSAAQIDLSGGADSGIDGPLVAVAPGAPASAVAVSPGVVDSTSVRIMGGQLDATLGTLTNPGARSVVYDVASTPGSGLYKLPLDGLGSAAPVPARISTESTLCSGFGARFSVIGQSLAGDEALITYQAPDAGGSCATGGVPKLVKLGMASTDAPLALPTGADLITPIGVIHGSSGQVAAVLAWQHGQYVLTDASLANAVPMASADVADVAGTMSASATPIGAGIVTRFGIFIPALDGLRRYDKSLSKVSAVLTDPLDANVQVNAFADDQALYVATYSAANGHNLYRISDTLLPTVTKLNGDGQLDPWGFRVLKSSVLYVAVGRQDFSAWNKASGQLSHVLANTRVLLSSSLYDRVFYSSIDSGGNALLASSALDGSDVRNLGKAQLLSGAIATQTTPFARSVRTNGAFSHAVVLVPASGQSGLNGAELRWLSFDAASNDIDAGSLPTTLGLGATAQAPGIVAEAGLLSIKKAADASASYVFVSQRAAGSLAQVGNAVH